MESMFDDLKTGLTEVEAFLAGERSGYNVSVPDWLEKTWKGAHERGLDKLTPDEIQAEIDGYRRENQSIRS